MLLLYEAKQLHQVTYDSKDQGGVFQVHTDEGIVELKPSARGLHYHNVSDPERNIKLMLVNTVRGNFKGYTCHEVKRARELQCIQGMIVKPTEREFAGMVHEELLTNCPVTVRDIDNANQIFGPDLANLRGKVTRTKPKRVQVKYVQIPWDFVQLHKYVTLVMDVMFMNGLPFLVTSSQGLSLVTIEHLQSRTAKRLVHTLEQVFIIYTTAGFVIQTALMDMEFEKLRMMMPHVALNTTAAREHIGEVEQKIIMIKERARGTFNTLPYKKIPKLMVIELLHFCVMWMNSFPMKSGISKKMEPTGVGILTQAGC